MRCNREIGEALIRDAEGREWYLRPSFFAMSQLGKPTEVVHAFRRICALFECVVMRKTDTPIHLFPLSLFSYVERIIDACMVSGNTRDLVGRVVVGKDGKLKHKRGAIGYSDLVILAFHLAKFGIVGRPRGRKGGDKGELKEFDASDFVGACIAHLGLSRDDAWQLTMTEFQRVMDSKFPDDNKSLADEIDEDRYAENMQWHNELLERMNNG